MRRPTVRVAVLALVLAACGRRAPAPPPAPVAGAAQAPGQILLRERAQGVGQPPGGRELVGYFGRGLIVSDSDVQRTIVNLDAGTYTIIGKADRTYWVMTFDEMFRQTAEMQRQRGRMEPLTFVPTGQTAMIAGHPTREYAARGERREGSVWLADDIPAPAEARRFEEIAAANGVHDLARTPLSPAIPGLDGLALRGRLVLGGGQERAEISREVTEVTDAAPAPDVLVVPDGFRRIPPPVAPAQ